MKLLKVRGHVVMKVALGVPSEMHFTVPRKPSWDRHGLFLFFMPGLEGGGQMRRTS